MYITMDYLNAVGASTETALKSQFTRLAAVLVTSAVLGGVVGYRHANGTAPEKAMPSLGPIPADAIAGLGFAVLAATGVAGDTDSMGYAMAEGASLACAGFFGATAGQSLGVKIAEKMKKKTDGAGGLQRVGGNYRDAHGQFMGTQSRQMPQATGAIPPASAVPQTQSQTA
jgi:hypothetical protein